MIGKNTGLYSWYVKALCILLLRLFSETQNISQFATLENSTSQTEIESNDE